MNWKMHNGIILVKPLTFEKKGSLFLPANAEKETRTAVVVNIEEGAKDDIGVSQNDLVMYHAKNGTPTEIDDRKLEVVHSSAIVASMDHADIPNDVQAIIDDLLSNALNDE